MSPQARHSGVSLLVMGPCVWVSLRTGRSLPASLLINASVATLRGLESNCGFRGASVSTAPCNGGNFRRPLCCVTSKASRSCSSRCPHRRQAMLLTQAVLHRSGEPEVGVGGSRACLPTPPACGDTVLWEQD